MLLFTPSIKFEVAFNYLNYNITFDMICSLQLTHAMRDELFHQCDYIKLPSQLAVRRCKSSLQRELNHQFGQVGVATCLVPCSDQVRKIIVIFKLGFLQKHFHVIPGKIVSIIFNYTLTTKLFYLLNCKYKILTFRKIRPIIVSLKK